MADIQLTAEIQGTVNTGSIDKQIAAAVNNISATVPKVKIGMELADGAQNDLLKQIVGVANSTRLSSASEKITQSLTPDAGAVKKNILSSAKSIGKATAESVSSGIADGIAKSQNLTKAELGKRVKERIAYAQKVSDNYSNKRSSAYKSNADHLITDAYQNGASANANLKRALASQPDAKATKAQLQEYLNGLNDNISAVEKSIKDASHNSDLLKNIKHEEPLTKAGRSKANKVQNKSAGYSATTTQSEQQTTGASSTTKAKGKPARRKGSVYDESDRKKPWGETAEEYQGAYEKDTLSAKKAAEDAKKANIAETKAVQAQFNSEKSKLEAKKKLSDGNVQVATKNAEINAQEKAIDEEKLKYNRDEISRDEALDYVNSKQYKTDAARASKSTPASEQINRNDRHALAQESHKNNPSELKRTTQSKEDKTASTLFQKTLDELQSNYNKSLSDAVSANISGKTDETANALSKVWESRIQGLKSLENDRSSGKIDNDQFTKQVKDLIKKPTEKNLNLDKAVSATAESIASSAEDVVDDTTKSWGAKGWKADEEKLRASLAESDKARESFVKSVQERRDEVTSDLNADEAKGKSRKAVKRRSELNARLKSLNEFEGQTVNGEPNPGSYSGTEEYAAARQEYYSGKNGVLSSWKKIRDAVNKSAEKSLANSSKVDVIKKDEKSDKIAKQAAKRASSEISDLYETRRSQLNDELNTALEDYNIKKSRLDSAQNKLTELKKSGAGVGDRSYDKALKTLGKNRARFAESAQNLNSVRSKISSNENAKRLVESGNMTAEQYRDFVSGKKNTGHKIEDDKSTAQRVAEQEERSDRLEAAANKEAESSKKAALAKQKAAENSAKASEEAAVATQKEADAQDKLAKSVDTATAASDKQAISTEEVKKNTQDATEQIKENTTASAEAAKTKSEESSKKSQARAKRPTLTDEERRSQPATSAQLKSASKTAEQLDKMRDTYSDIANMNLTTRSSMSQISDSFKDLKNIDKTAATVGEVEDKIDKGNQAKSYDAVKYLKASQSAAKELKSTYDDINKALDKSNDYDFSKNTGATQSVENLKAQRDTLKGILDDINNANVDVSVGKIEGATKQAQTVLESVKDAFNTVDITKSFEDTQQKLSNMVGKYSEYAGDKGVSNDVRTRLQSLNDQLSSMEAVKASADGSAESINRMRNSIASANTVIRENAAALKEDASQIDEQANASVKAISLENKRQNLIRQVNDAIKHSSAAKFSDNSDSVEAYNQLLATRKTLEDMGEVSNNGAVDLAKAEGTLVSSTQALKSNVNVLREGGDYTQTFGEKLTGLASKFTEWFGVSQIIMQAVNTVRQMFTESVAVDTAMTELKKVTDETSTTYDNFLEGATDRAQKLGTGLSDIINSTADFARLGYSLKEATGLADAATLYKNVGDDIDSIDDASQSIISTMQAFRGEDQDVTEYANSIVDKFNAVGNNFAISSGGIGEALLRSASSLKSANNTLDESIALTTAANTVIQDPDKVGTALKTVSMYLRAAKTEAEDAGESTDGMADSVSKLRDELLSLTGGAVDIQKDNNTFKSTYEILKELSGVWGSLTDITQANILEKIGGKRNSNVVSAILDNFDVAEKVLQTSLNSAGSAEQENAKYLDSVQGKLNQLKASFQTLSTSFADSNSLKFFIEMGTDIVSATNAVSGLIEKVGGLRTVLILIGGKLISSNLDKIGARFQKFGANIKAKTEAFDEVINGPKHPGGVKVEEPEPGWKVYTKSTGAQALDNAATDVTASATAASAAVESVSAAENSVGSDNVERLSVANKEAAMSAEELAAAERAVNEQFNAVGEAEKSRQLEALENAPRGSFDHDVESEYNRAGIISKERFSKDLEFWSNVADIDKADNIDDAVKRLGKLDEAERQLVISSSKWSGKIDASQFKNIAAGADDAANSIDNVAKSSANVEKSLQTAGSGVSSFFSRMGSFLKANWANIATIGATAAIAIYSAIKQHQQEVLDNAQQSVSDWKSQYDTLSGQIESYKSLKEQLSSSNLSEEESLSIRQQILDIQNQIVSTYGSEASGIDLVNGKLDEQIAKLQQAAQANARKTLAENSSNYNEAMKQLNKEQGVAFDIADIPETNKFRTLLRQAGFETKNHDNGSYLYSLEGSIEEIAPKLTGLKQQLEDIRDTASADSIDYGQASKLLAELDDYSDIYSKYSEYHDTIADYATEKLVANGGIDYFEKYRDDVSELNSMLSDPSNIDSSAYDEIQDSISGDVEALKDFRNELASQGDNESLVAYIDSELQEIGNTIDADGSKVLQFTNGVRGWQKFLGGHDNSIARGASPFEIYGHSRDHYNNIKSDLKQINSLHMTEDKLVDAILDKQNDSHDLAMTLISDMGEGLSGIKLGTDGEIVPETTTSQLQALANMINATGAISEGVADKYDAANQALSDLTETMTTAISAQSALNSALSESVSATGISADALKSLEQIYGDDLQSAIERTTNGLHLNADALEKLQRTYDVNEKSNYLDGLEKQYEALSSLFERINTEGAKGNDVSGLVDQYNTIGKNVEQLKNLQAQYEATTSAYNQWQLATNNGSERTGYESMGKEYSNVKDLLDHGWADDEVKDYLKLMTGAGDETLKTVSDCQTAFNGLASTIPGTTHAIADFFTFDENGNSTSDGVYNFLDTVKEKQDEVHENWVTLDKDGNYSFDFQNGQKLADALGVSVDLIEQMSKAAIEAGFDVNFDREIESVDDLRSSADEAKKSLQELTNSNNQTDELNTLSRIDTVSDIDTSSSGAAEKIQNNIDKINEFKKDVSEAYANNEISADVKTDELEKANQMLEYYLELMGEINGTRITNDPAKLNDAIASARKELSGLSGQLHSGVDVDTDEIDAAVQKLTNLYAAKRNLADEDTPLMTIDTSGLDEETANAVSDLQSLNAQINTLNALEAVGSYYGITVDTSSAAASVASLISQINSANPTIWTTIGVAEDTVQQAINADGKTPVSVQIQAINTIQDAIQSTGQSTADAGIDYKVVNQEKPQDGYIAKFAYHCTYQTPPQNGKVATFTYVATNPGVLKGGTVKTGGGSSGGGKTKTGKAHASGTVRGSNVRGLGLANNESKTLINELGAELIVRDGKSMIVNNGLPTMDFPLRRGDIIFNAEQTQELLKHGYSNSYAVENMRSSHADGTVLGNAFASTGRGSGGGKSSTVTSYSVNNVPSKSKSSKSSKSSGSSSPNKSSSSNSDNSSKEDEKQTVDWIEVLIKRIERAITNFGNVADNTFKTLSDRLSASSSKIAKIGEEISVQQSAYDRYIQQANSVGLSEDLASRVRDGTIDINEYDSDTQKLISDYQSWYEKALDCSDAIEELDKNLSQLYEDRFNDIAKDYENQLNDLEHVLNTYDTYLSRAETNEDYGNGSDQKKSFYREQYSAKKQERAIYEREAAALSQNLDEAVQSGQIIEGTEAWYDMVKTINEAYENIDKCDQALDEYVDNIKQADVDKFNGIADSFGDQISVFEHAVNMYETGIDKVQAEGYIGSKTYYKAMSDATEQQIALQKEEFASLKQSLQESLDSGEIEKFSSEWHDCIGQINSVTEAIDESDVKLKEYANDMRQLDWDRFDFLQEEITDIADEADFLIKTLENTKLFDEKGNMTENGLGTLGLHGIEFDTYTDQASKYADKVKELNKALESTPYDTTLIKQRNEYLQKQRESIEAAINEKEAVKDLVEDGIEKELDYLQKLIDKYADALDSAKDLRDYQESIDEKSKNISSLQKQIAAYQGDDSEENKSRVQKLNDSLSDALKDMEDTQYDKSISAQKDMLDELYNKYEELEKARLEDINALFAEEVAVMNSNAGTISAAITSNAQSVGYVLSGPMTSITTSLGTIYGQEAANGGIISGGFANVSGKIGAVSTAINSMSQEMDKAIKAVESEAAARTAKIQMETQKQTNPTPSSPSKQKKVVPNAASNSSQVKKYTPQKTTTTPAPKTTQTQPSAPAQPSKSEQDKYGVAIAIINGNYGWGNDPYRSGKLAQRGYNASEIQNIVNKLCREGLVASSRWEGHYYGLRLSDLSRYRYKNGGLVDFTGLAQLDGTKSNPEMVLNAKDTSNFIALKDAMRDIAKGDSVLAALFGSNAATRSITSDLANARSVPRSNTNVDQNIEYNISIPIERVNDYNDFVNQLKSDNKFEKMIQSMTIDRVGGKSPLAKNKYKW